MGSYELAYQFVWDMLRDKNGEEQPERLRTLFRLLRQVSAPVQQNLLEFVNERIGENPGLDGILPAYEKHMIEQGVTKERFLALLKESDKEFYYSHVNWMVRYK